MPTRSCPSGRWETPHDHNGAGEGDAEGDLHPPGVQGEVPYGCEMPLPPVGPGRHPLRLGRIWLTGGEGDPDQGGGEVGGAQVLAGQHGDDHLPHGMARTGVGLTVAPCGASRAPRGLTSLTAGLARGPSTPGAGGRLVLLLGRLHTGPGRESAPGVAANVWRPRVERDRQTGRGVQGTNGVRGSKDGAMQQ